MTAPKAKPKSGRLVQWFGANTQHANLAGRLLDGCAWVGIPFSGGMSEVPSINARLILCGDRHRHIINLCQVIASEEGRTWLASEADKMPFHPDVLKSAQEKACKWQWLDGPSAEAALWYFVSTWLNRGGKAGTDAEFKGNLPMRWDAAGGGSNQRFRTAIETIEEFGQTFRRCEFTCLDAFEFLANVKDNPASGLYVDAPWPSTGDGYRHAFTVQQQRDLARVLAEFKQTRVVVRFGVHPLIDELYPRDVWYWRGVESRTQANKACPEVYLLRNCDHGQET